MLKQCSHCGLVAVDEGTKYTILVYLSVKKANRFVNILLLKIFFADYCHLSSCVSA